MLYGVFSDVHSNLEALEAVLAFFEKKRVSAYICAGDIVGYGPNPNEVVSRLRSLPDLAVVAGNHDWAVAGKKELDWFTDYAARAIIWTKRQIKEESRNFLSRLPEKIETSKFTVAHGSPRDPIDEYVLSLREFKENIDDFHSPVCFVGHTHRPRAYLCEGASEQKYLRTIDITYGDTVKLGPANKLIYNAGSVGQPRDGDVRASCGIYDTEKEEITLHRVSYNVELTQEKMRRSSLPLFLIERLSYGK